MLQALKRQKSVALAAATGVIKNNFLGMKTKISPQKTTQMLANVRDNAPQAPSASEAQYNIGRVWQKDGNAQKALASYLLISADYPNSTYAPEAQYQRGQILILKAERGNQNRAHLNQARDIFQDLIERYPATSAHQMPAKALPIWLTKIFNAATIQPSFTAKRETMNPLFSTIKKLFNRQKVEP